MRYLPARHRNGYHRTLTRQQRHNRWLLWMALVLLTVGGNRLVAGCQQVEPPTGPRITIAALLYNPPLGIR
jgi:hypothetical protein